MEDKEAGPALRLFDRDRTAHPWAEAFAEMKGIDEQGRWAVAANWRMDHRVSPEREDGDLLASGHFSSGRDFEGWWKSLNLYFQEELCRPSLISPGMKASAYSRVTNARNRLAFAAPGFDQLVHVGSLVGMLRRIAGGLRKDSAEMFFQDLASRGFPKRSGGEEDADRFKRQVIELGHALREKGPAAVRKAAGFVMDALSETAPPWWACFAADVEDLILKRDPAALCAGLGDYQVGDCLLVWIYRTDEAGPLFRPTVVEASRTAYHFPSPPGYPMGITMPLRDSLQACREVLHPPLPRLLAEQRCTGEILFLTESSGVSKSGTLAALRAAHWERLKEEFYTDGLAAWASRHPEPR
jgi:hypothetical protein